MPGPPASPELAELDDFRRELLLRSLGLADERADLMIVDTASGASRQTVELCRGLVRLGILPKSALLGDYLKQAGKGKYGGKRPKLHLNDLFMHGTSHWIGLDVTDGLLKAELLKLQDQLDREPCGQGSIGIDTSLA